MQDTEFQVAFRDSAKDLMGRHDNMNRCRNKAESPAVDRKVWEEIAEAGWFAVLVPEDDGGLGRGLSDMAVIAQEAGEQLFAEPYLVGAVQIIEALVACPASELRTQLLDQAMAGQLVAGLSWQDRLGQLSAESPSVSAAAQSDGFVLQGRQRFVTPVRDADGWIVLAQDLNAQPLLAWVPANSKGVRVQETPSVDGSMMGDLWFEQVAINQSQVLVSGPEAIKIVDRANDASRLMAGAELLGVMRRALAMTIDYMKIRKQFGKPIASFQALKHRTVHAWVSIEIAQAGLFAALDDVARGESLARAASRVKARCAETALAVTKECIQLHGAIGFTDEYDIGLYLKRAMVLATWLGNAPAHRHRYLSLAPTLSQVESKPVDVEVPADKDWNAMSDEDFRNMLRTFYRRNYPSELRNIQRRLTWEEVRDWTMTLSRQGWIAPGWPAEFGGMGLTPEKLLAFVEEQENYGVARTIDQGVVMVAPLLIQFGTPEQQARFLPKMLNAEHRWCQGYSEPNAGSDLASLKTSAVADGDDFIVNGQKIWTTMAHSSNHIFTLVRTDNSAKKQAGISFLLIDMETPGITVRPIKDITGDTEFCEVFFKDVRVPKENLIGEINQGWTMAKALLGFERIFLGSPKQVRYSMSQLDALAKERGLFDCPIFRDRYAQLLLDVDDQAAAYESFAELIKRGEPMPPSVSLLKIWGTETYQRICQTLMDAAQDSGALHMAYDTQTSSLNVPAILFNSIPSTIYGGSTEIQCEILARAVLGMAD
ncbi:acyl-CoA dehydrogenase [Orrella sp. 11846]|uniref:acyl-CoA dehydrogenase n=1 Tax=Orrella sp. 11846 TaxID=3409913 RepID=UPI003B5ADA63